MVVDGFCSAGVVRGRVTLTWLARKRLVLDASGKIGTLEAVLLVVESLTLTDRADLCR